MKINNPNLVSSLDSRMLSWDLKAFYWFSFEYHFETHPYVIINKLIQRITLGFRTGLTINRFVHSYHTLTEVFEFVIVLITNLNFVLTRGSQGSKNQ